MNNKTIIINYVKILIILITINIYSIAFSERIDFLNYINIPFGITLRKLKTIHKNIKYADSIDQHCVELSGEFFSSVLFEFDGFFGQKSGKSILGLWSPKLVKITLYSGKNKFKTIKINDVENFIRLLESLWGTNYETYLAKDKHNPSMFPYKVFVWHKETTEIVAYVFLPENIQQMKQNILSYQNTPFFIELFCKKRFFKEIHNNWELTPLDVTELNFE